MKSEILLSIIISFSFVYLYLKRPEEMIRLGAMFSWFALIWSALNINDTSPRRKFCKK